MDAHWIQTYWLAITVIEAQNYLMQLKIAMAPEGSKSSLETLQKDLNKKAYPTYTQRAISPQELEGFLNG